MPIRHWPPKEHELDLMVAWSRAQITWRHQHTCHMTCISTCKQGMALWTCQWTPSSSVTVSCCWFLLQRYQCIDKHIALALPFASWQKLRLFPWTPFWPFPCHLCYPYHLPMQMDTKRVRTQIHFFAHDLSLWLVSQITYARHITTNGTNICSYVCVLQDWMHNVKHLHWKLCWRQGDQARGNYLIWLNIFCLSTLNVLRWLLIHMCNICEIYIIPLTLQVTQELITSKNFEDERSQTYQAT